VIIVHEHVCIGYLANSCCKCSLVGKLHVERSRFVDILAFVNINNLITVALHIQYIYI